MPIALTFFLLFILCIGVLLVASRLVIDGVEHFSQNTKVSSFATSVLLLGIITSITEISVGVNAILAKSPEIFVGNLIGGSFVVLLLIIPLLAVLSDGIELKGRLDQKRLFFFLVLIITPSFLAIDGRLNQYDAFLLFILYGLFFFLFQSQQKIFSKKRRRKIDKRSIAFNLFKILVGAALIYGAGKYFVMSAEYFSLVLGVPEFMLSIFLLAIGTNLPELSIAFSAVQKKQTDIAFGDYVGSAAANPLLFGVFVLLNGSFAVSAIGFNVSLAIMILGYIAFFLFARSKAYLSRREGLFLLLIYSCFMIYEATEIFIISPTV